jgi:predicted SprT family Zn-dependent metalloprotease
MDFELVIGSLGDWDTQVEVGRYYSQFQVIAINGWTGLESEEQMADILSHEFIHHLLWKLFGSLKLRDSQMEPVGCALDNIRSVTKEEIQMIDERGIHQAWNYLSPRSKFALRCSALCFEDDYEPGNGVL